MNESVAIVERPKVPLANAHIEGEVALVLKRLHAHGFTIGGDGKARAPSDGEALTTAYIATQYGLDPLLGEIQWLGGKLYIPHAALERKARESKLIKRRKCRPATLDERAAARCGDDEEYWIAEIETVDGIVYDGHGWASLADVAIARGPGGVRILRNMAEKRALQRALRYAVGISLPDPEDAPTIVGQVAPAAIADKGAALAKAAAALGAPIPSAVVDVAPPSNAAAEAVPVAPSALQSQAEAQTVDPTRAQRLTRRVALLMQRGVPEADIERVFAESGAILPDYIATLPAASADTVWIALDEIAAQLRGGAR